MIGHLYIDTRESGRVGAVCGCFDMKFHSGGYSSQQVLTFLGGDAERSRSFIIRQNQFGQAVEGKGEDMFEIAGPASRMESMGSPKCPAENTFLL